MKLKLKKYKVEIEDVNGKTHIIFEEESVPSIYYYCEPSATRRRSYHNERRQCCDTGKAVYSDKIISIRDVDSFYFMEVIYKKEVERTVRKRLFLRDVATEKFYYKRISEGLI